MSSWQTRAVCAFLRATRKRRYLTPERGLRALGSGLPAAAPPASVAARLSAELVGPQGGRRVYLLPGAGATAGLDAGAVVYVHGGAFVNGIARQHWELVEALASVPEVAEVSVPFYGLAPEHHVDDAHGFLGAALERVLARHRRIHLVGDSAGGNLALLMAQRYAGEARLTGLTLIAPALDLSLSNPGIDVVEPHDPWLTRAGLRPILGAWAGRRELDDPVVSPLFGCFAGLPPTEVYVGTRDICAPDCRTLQDRAPGDWDLTLHERMGSPHVYPLLPTPEGLAARTGILSQVRRSLSG